MAHGILEGSNFIDTTTFPSSLAYKHCIIPRKIVFGTGHCIIPSHFRKMIFTSIWYIHMHTLFCIVCYKLCIYCWEGITSHLPTVFEQIQFVKTKLLQSFSR